MTKVAKVSHKKAKKKLKIIKASAKRHENKSTSKVKKIKPKSKERDKKAVVDDTFENFDTLRNSTNSNLFTAAFASNDVSDMEEEYEEQLAKDPKPSNKLPIKTAGGFVQTSKFEEVEDDCDSMEEEEVIEDTNEIEIHKEITAAELLLDYSKILESKKIEIAALSASILENPTERINNFTTLMRFFSNDKLKGYITLKKLVVVSLQEVFKELLPSYKITSSIEQDVKFKKETFKLAKFETSLLQHYKKFLQILERLCASLFRRQAKVLTISEIALGAFCDLLETHANFNYADNIAQTLAPLINSSQKQVRSKVCSTFKNIVKSDKKGEITLKILRLMNQSIKKNPQHTKPEALEVLLSLHLKDVNLDREREQLQKQKKLQSHKGNVLRLSKMEKKRKARLDEIEKELLEVKAEENKQAKNKFQAEILKITFGILFRTLKTSNNTNIVRLCLQGVAKYAHCINMEFYFDLISILDKLLKEEWADFCCKQYCIQTVFKILSEQGDVLNLDPLRFYNSLYENLLDVHAARNYEHFEVVLESLTHCLIKRHKKISNKRATAFLKRITTLSLQLVHNGTMGSLGIVKSLLQLNKSYDILLDLEASPGDGQFQAELPDAEFCNASATALFELSLLSRHYHPDVVGYSKYIADGVVAVQGTNVPLSYGRSSAEELYNSYDMSTMAFFPSIPIPKAVKRKKFIKDFEFCDEDLKRECKYILDKIVVKNEI